MWGESLGDYRCGFVRGPSTAGNLMSIIVQRDATIYSFIIFSADSSTCFGLYPHPSSGTHSKL